MKRSATGRAFHRGDKRIVGLPGHRNLGPGQPILYDLSSTYYEGSTCVLAQRGYSRDGKTGTRQINFGLLYSQKALP